MIEFVNSCNTDDSYSTVAQEFGAITDANGVVYVVRKRRAQA